MRQKCKIARKIKHWFIFPLIIFLSSSFFIINEENTFLYGTSENLFLNSNGLHYDFENFHNLNLNESKTQNKCELFDKLETNIETSSNTFEDNLGDPYVNTVVTESSFWYFYGERAIGAPDNAYATIFFDYGNGYIILDMGKNEEIINGEGNDFKIIAQGGEYSISVGNNLSQMFKFLGLGTGNKSFDISSSNLYLIRYISVEYRSGDDIELDAVVATNYNQPESTIVIENTSTTQTIVPYSITFLLLGLIVASFTRKKSRQKKKMIKISNENLII